jgi:hypothetical protein
MLKKPAEYERDTSSAKYMVISRKDSTDSLIGIPAGYFQRALVDESGII